MALEILNMKRKFIFNKKELADPNADLTAAEVMNFYSTQHSELTTATIDGPAMEGDVATYTFKTTVGTKG